jgi:AraC-like DNA-binding protein
VAGPCLFGEGRGGDQREQVLAQHLRRVDLVRAAGRHQHGYVGLSDAAGEGRAPARVVVADECPRGAEEFEDRPPGADRDGGQAQFLDRSTPAATAHTLAGTRDRALRHLGEALPLDVLARPGRVSPRTLVRMWRQETGVSPHRWLLTARIGHARELMGVTCPSVEQSAARSGLGSVTHDRGRRVKKLSPDGIDRSVYGLEQAR